MASEIPEVRPTHFFKIILAQNLHEGKLMMPRKFVEKYGEGLSKAIYLKTPNGAKWKLNLVKSDGKIWFQKGWKEFAECHSLAHGHLLLFKYKRNSYFLVHIFEKSAFEINYPFQRVAAKTNRVSNGQGNKPPNGESRRASQKTKDNSFELHQPCDIGSSSCFRVEKLKKVASLHHTDRESKGKEAITAKRVTTLERAQSFKTCNPSFVVIMRASYVKHHFLLNIPRSFGNRHFDLDKKRGDIYFQVLNKGVWPAKYSIKKTRNGLHFELMTTGWKAFAKDNKLKVDDVCKFELISCTILTFIVHIFRETDNDNTNCSTSQRDLFFHPMQNLSK